MADLKIINDVDYEAYYKELYLNDGAGPVLSRYRVPLDPDPSICPMSINKKLSEVQAYKDRVVVILNHAIQNKSHWETLLKKLESKFDSEVNMALTSDTVKNSGNAGIQKAVALRVASNSIVAEIWKGEGKYEDRLSGLSKKYAEASAFLAEVKNLFENLDSTSMNLAVQLKSMMMNARLYNPMLPGGDK